MLIFVKPARQSAQPAGQHHLLRIHSLLDPKEHHSAIRAAREQDGRSVQSRHPRFVPPHLSPLAVRVHATSQERTKIRSTSSRSSPLPELVCPLPITLAPLPFLTIPADDDGSGTTTLVTILTSLLRESFVPSVHTLEFHFYSAEEGGCLGSGDISRTYVSEGKIVRGMMHM